MRCIIISEQLCYNNIDKFNKEDSQPMSFINELQTSTNKTARTENGAVSNTSTLDPVLDFFSKAGAMRGREVEAFSLFQKAFDAHPQNAIRVLFYLRDIRGGQGERSVFSYILDQLDEDFVAKIAHYIPEYGRWDEVPLNDATAEIISHQLSEDFKHMEEGLSISLLAKWMPSENAGKASFKDARKLAKLLGWVGNPIEIKTVGVDENGGEVETIKRIPNLAPYRRNVVKLRKYYENFLEHLMSEKRWGEIDYSKLPSQAHKKHVKAFFRNDETRYKAYLDSVTKGEAKINAGTLFAYQLYDMVAGYRATDDEKKAANPLWANLPDYTRGQNALVLADVSGSMAGFPMSVSVSLALYFAERNEGQFKDYFMTFTSQSRLQKISGDTLEAKMRSIETANWDMGTNLQSAFDAILKAARDGNATPDEMPSTLYIISDMQFDEATARNDKTNFEVIAEKFKTAGYELPHVVFWNCSAYGKDSPATVYDERVTLISGSNQSAFQYAVEGKTPMQSMLDILNSDRYAGIVI